MGQEGKERSGPGGLILKLVLGSLYCHWDCTSLFLFIFGS